MAVTQRSRQANAYVSERLRDLRKEHGMSQAQLAAFLKERTVYSWTVQSVSRAEICEGPLIKRWCVDDLYALSEAFDVPVAYFLPEVN